MATPPQSLPTPPGLRYSGDDEPGIHRIDEKSGVKYRDAKGRLVRDKETLARIRALVIPPAWTAVWICRDARGHLQATGRDARGRKQYRYHARWRESRDADKFAHMVDFAAVLPTVRRRVRSDLALPGLQKRRVLATLVRLLETTCMRIGNERYAEENDSFGLTTLRNRHVKVDGGAIELQFRGKSGKFHKARVEDDRLVRIIRRCRDLPGQSLFEYLDDEGAPQALGSSDVNAYLKDITGADITAKDFRTWAGTVFVANELAKHEDAVGPPHMVAAIRLAADRLGNTPAICRKAYVHPKVLDPSTWAEKTRRVARRTGLRTDEAALLALLKPVKAARRTPRPRASMSPPSPCTAAHHP